MNLDLGWIGKIAEWVGINAALAQVLPWLASNGTLGLAIFALLGLPVSLFLVHKSERIPVKIPFARSLGKLNVTLLLSFYLLFVLLIGAMFVRDVVVAPEPVSPVTLKPENLVKKPDTPSPFEWGMDR